MHPALSNSHESRYSWCISSTTVSQFVVLCIFSELPCAEFIEQID